MAKAKFERTKPHVNIGTIGHVDHGKTTLTPKTMPTGLLHNVPHFFEALLLFLHSTENTES